MKKIETVAVLGAGALGLMYMEAFRIAGIEAYFLAGDVRCDRINSENFVINGKEMRFKARNPEKEKLRPDLILLAVKNYHMNEAVDLMRPAVTPGTILISVLNGISSEGILEEAFPEADVLYAAALGMDAVKERHILNFSVRGKLLVGSKGNTMTPALQRTTALLDQSSLTYHIPEDIHKALWYKLMINIGMNQVSAVTGANYGLFQTDDELKSLMKSAMKETIRVARAEAVNLTETDLEAWDAVLNSLGPEGKTSMLQDMEAGRKTEVDSFAGELIRRAVKHGLTVPVNETLLTIIKTKEKITV